MPILTNFLISGWAPDPLTQPVSYEQCFGLRSRIHPAGVSSSRVQKEVAAHQRQVLNVDDTVKVDIAISRAWLLILAANDTSIIDVNSIIVIRVAGFQLQRSNGLRQAKIDVRTQLSGYIQVAGLRHGDRVGARCQVGESHVVAQRVNRSGMVRPKAKITSEGEQHPAPIGAALHAYRASD